jgi:hypothetical protein
LSDSAENDPRSQAGVAPDDGQAAARRLRICGYTWLVVGVAALTVGLVAHPLGLTNAVLLGTTALGICGAVTAWATDRLPQLILLGVSAGLSLAAAEVYLRNTVYAADHHNRLFQYDATLGWRFVPGAFERVKQTDYRHFVRINAEGFRDVDSPRTVGEDQRLVAVIGDSFTSNLGVALEQTFTSVMNERLGPDTVVKNFGVNGFGQVQELLLLEELLMTQRPDVALVLVYWRNDLDDNTGRFDWVRGYRRPKATRTEGGLQIKTGFPPPAPRGPEDTPGELSLRRFVSSFALHKLAKAALERETDLARLPRSRQPPEVRYGALEIAATERDAIALTMALLDEMRATAAAHDTPLAFVFAPSLWQVETERWNGLLSEYSLAASDYARDQPQRTMLAHCEERRWACLDLQPALREHADRDERLYYPREEHWTADGNARVAQAIADWLEAQRWLE